MMEFIKRNFITLSMLGILILGIMGAKTVLHVQEIEKGKVQLNYNIDKLDRLVINLPKIKYENLVTSDDPSAGSPDAKVHIVEFSDFQCPFCKESYPVILKLIDEYGDKIHFVYRDFPLPTHPYARKAAEAAECAQDQGSFWDMHNIIFENQQEMTISDLQDYAVEIGLNTNKFNECLLSSKYASEVDEDYKTGQRVGVSGTPTFFINNIIVRGYLSYEQMKSIIDAELVKPDN